MINYRISIHYSTLFMAFIFALKTESSFKLELFLFVVTLIILWFLDLAIHLNFVIIVASLLVLLTELINSAIETVVDMITVEYNELVKKAKDIGSAAVMVSISMYLISWLYVVWSIL
ncbi:diacylglycerol kinase [Aliarcobacter skirrowii]|uniref:diacylglycerol kinase n=1 Tax=Aliarcobacter skirrowii TaxID=28200 RepID=UPI001D174E7E|nr:diacylglycerol kinase [Aliarcobacter skirrowii]